MNRIVFAGLCLIGMMVLAFANAKAEEQKKQQETKLVKEHSNSKLY